MGFLKKNILILIPSLTLGGAEKQALYYAKIIAQSKEFKPVVIGLGRQGELVSLLDSHGISYDSFVISNFITGGKIKKLVTLFRFILFIRKHKPSKIIGFTYWGNIMGGLAWKFSGADQFYWNQRSIDTEITSTFWERLVIKFSPEYIANSKTCVEFIRKRHSIKNSGGNVILNAIDIIGYETKSHSNNPLRFLMISNFFPEKDHETVIYAVDEYYKKEGALPIEIHFIGSSPGKSSQFLEAKSLAFDLNLCGKIFFHGTVNVPGEFLAKADVGILSTRSEGFSNAIMEYMIHALPVIATDIAANREVLGEINTNNLFTVGNVLDLTRLFVKFTDEKYRKEQGYKNYNLALEMFNIDNFKREIFSVLKLNGE